MNAIILDAFLANYCWYRKWRGGHWEQWSSCITHGCVWIQFPKCTREYIRPGGCCGTPTCEDHNEEVGV